CAARRASLVCAWAAPSQTCAGKRSASRLCQSASMPSGQAEGCGATADRSLAARSKKVANGERTDLVLVLERQVPGGWDVEQLRLRQLPAKRDRLVQREQV